MKRLLQNRLVLQLALTLIAAASLAGISIVVITDAIRGAESVVLNDTSKTLSAALRELRREQQERTSSDSGWPTLPAAARDLSLRALSYTVLSSFPGVEGGFYNRHDQFLGYSYPTHDTGSLKTDIPSAERPAIAALAQRTVQQQQPVQTVLRGKIDLVVLSAVPGALPGSAIWVMKRLPGRAQHTDRAFLPLLVLIAAALCSILGALAIGLKLEAQLRREARLRSLGRLAAGLAHEIRNPLNSIRLTVQLLEHRLRSGRLAPDDFATIRAEVDRLSTLLNDLLDLQRTRQPQPKSQPVAPVLEHCLALLDRQAQLSGVRLSLDIPDRSISAAFDAHQLTQALMNLLLNALEASPPGSTVTLSVRRHKSDVTLEVEDRGPGLNHEQQEHLFEPFYTTKPAGTGLGLAVSRELIRSQGGDLSYQPGSAGARFILQLPT
ncbi:MAG TPA: ATP-binding protein [Bryobacteraceae bacterium]|nr:ATP-binding protein [Bryobacteraceae bacterium]